MYAVSNELAHLLRNSPEMSSCFSDRDLIQLQLTLRNLNAVFTHMMSFQSHDNAPYLRLASSEEGLESETTPESPGYDGPTHALTTGKRHRTSTTKEQKECIHCGTKTSTQWRKGPFSAAMYVWVAVKEVPSPNLTMVLPSTGCAMLAGCASRGVW